RGAQSQRCPLPGRAAQDLRSSHGLPSHAAQRHARLLLGEALRREGEVHYRRLGGAKYGQHPAVLQRHPGD
ncbi:unnamed protein product, partial [Ectocarpus sp. 12 AP-2014]